MIKAGMTKPARKELWDAPLSFRVRCIAKSGSEVFVAGTFGACVLNAKTGKVLRQTTLPGTMTGSRFVLTKDLWLIPMSNEGVTVLDRKSLAERWSHRAGDGVCGVAVEGDAAYVTSWHSHPGQAKGAIARRQLATGAIDWARAIGSFGPAPTVASGLVCAGLADDGVWFGNKQTGDETWRPIPPRRVSTQGTASFDGTLLHLNDDDKTGKAAVYALDPESQRIEWAQTLKDAQIMTNLLRDGGFVYTATRWKSWLYCFGATSGKLRWPRVDLDRKGEEEPVWNGWLTVHKNLLYLHTESSLRRFRVASGKPASTLWFRNSELTTYRIEGDTLFVGVEKRGPTESHVLAYPL